MPTASSQDPWVHERRTVESAYYCYKRYFYRLFYDKFESFRRLRRSRGYFISCRCSNEANLTVIVPRLPVSDDRWRPAITSAVRTPHFLGYTTARVADYPSTPHYCSCVLMDHLLTSYAFLIRGPYNKKLRCDPGKLPKGASLSWKESFCGFRWSPHVIC